MVLASAQMEESGSAQKRVRGLVVPGPVRSSTSLVQPDSGSVPGGHVTKSPVTLAVGCSQRYPLRQSPSVLQGDMQNRRARRGVSAKNSTQSASSGHELRSHSATVQ